ncbi:hypothetical protein GLP24_10550 [Photobacterium carnosum]|nr:hypothetical protein [Photobacterium carnosum]MCD9545290.1 hypothetical protein [Photobacterium carnosum]
MALKTMTTAASSLSRNPLGIIALFIVLIYGFAALVVATGDSGNELYPIVWFLVVFPFMVLGTFGWLVSKHHEKLYAPSDFKGSDFLEALGSNKGSRPNLGNLDKQIEHKVKSVLQDLDLTQSTDAEELKVTLTKAAETITSEIRSSSFITVDAREFTGEPSDIFEFPADAFSSFSDLTNEIYFLLESRVGPFEYGYSWQLMQAGQVIKNSRMITGEKPGVPLTDNRPLNEVGILAGSKLQVTQGSNG